MDRDLDSVKRNGLSVGIRISLHFFVAYVVLKLEFKLKHSVLNTIFGFCCPIGKAHPSRTTNTFALNVSNLERHPGLKFLQHTCVIKFS